jgi:hypothetical protein
MANAIAVMKMVPTTLSSHFSSSETLFGNPPLTPSPCPNYTTRSSSQVTTEFAQQFVEAPPPAKPVSAGHEDKSEEPKARALTLEFKKVNEVYVYAIV